MSLEEKQSFTQQADISALTENKAELFQEEIEDGIWKPSIFKPFEDSLGVGASTKELKEIIGRPEAKIRITGNKERFDKTFSEQDEETQKIKLGAGRILINLLRRIAPEANPHDIEKTALEHGNKIVVIDKEYLKEDRQERAKTIADGMITNLKEIPLMVAAADCAPIGVYDPENQVLGMFHSGWKGTLKQISSEGIKQMSEVYGSSPEKLLVVIGPYAGGKDFSVSRDTYDAFHGTLNEGGGTIYSEEEVQSFFIEKDGQYFLDIGEAARLSLIKVGVLPENIQISNYSTMNEEGNKLFSSERVEGKEDRDSFALMMVLK